MSRDYASLAALLRCPATHQSVQYTQQVEDFKAFIGDDADLAAITAGYLNADRTHFYPILDGIICMMPNTASDSLHGNVQRVRDFYNAFGWTRDEKGRYQDSRLFIEEKKEVDKYYYDTTVRALRFLKPKGRYVLDVASGPVFQEENKALSRNFETRICVDISIRALQEARKNIGDAHGIFINGDITNLPLADGICDNVMSIHTLYHVPSELQEKGVRELLRVCQPGSNVVIFYNWAWHSWLMNVALLPIRAVKAAQRAFRALTKPAKDRWISGGLYFYPHTPAWFERIAASIPGLKVSFHSLTSIHQDFVKYYVHDATGGPSLLRWVKNKEEKHDQYLGRHGAFGYVVYHKP